MLLKRWGDCLTKFFIFSFYINNPINNARSDIMKKRKFIAEESSEDDFSIYSRHNRESQLEGDELSPIEEAFMVGYNNAI